jgi:periplasmic copper chaperone A
MKEYEVNKLSMLLIPLFLLLLGSCGQPPELKVNEAVVKLSPVDDNPSALYFTVHGGEQATELLRVVSRSAVRTEMHDSVSDPKTGMLTMKPIARIAVPAKGKLEFKRGGKHVMVWGINLPARRLEKMDFIFTFASGDRIIVTAPIEKITTGGGGDHSDH